MPYLLEIPRLMRLCAPILVAQVAQTSMSFVDTIMAGQVSATDLAAVAVATSFWLPLILLVQGVIMALTPIISQLNGARRQSEVAGAVHQGFWLTVLVTLPAMLVLYYSPLALHWMNVEPLLAEKTAGYLHAILWGMPAYALYQVLRNFSEGLSFTLPTMIIGFIGLMVNIPANYILIHGKLGLPQLGAVGCGYASALVFWVMLLGMIIYTHKSPLLQPFNVLSRLTPPNWPQIGRLCRLGFPIAMAIFCEVTLFTVVALLLAPLGTEIVAGHQIAINFSSIIFMIPLSLGMAVTIRIGHTLGEYQAERAKVISIVGIIFGCFIALLCAISTVAGRYWIGSIYTDNSEVLTLAASLLLLASLYQISDSAQVIAAAALRGYKDTQTIFYITFSSFWLCGLPIGMVLGMTDWLVPPMGPHGFWVGFLIALSIAAFSLIWRLRVIYARVEHNRRANLPLVDGM
ncbi:MATE family efflux transporter [Oceanisphaera pacifica]|uniref:Multidrug-efflux transporter n=1 Tax=Oceanisphaera pacifica TaxID=2818389 RepID=A0ABS3NGN0_9GAMM|nr:MATE family efflux transporter [Oceanisphaera pacifica]MBO1519435.1 MATE family efflux transporter [Oceanisphaera pacifica]